MLPVLQAERQLLAIEAASVPHMVQTSRVGVLTRWQRHASRDRGDRRPLSLAETLGGLKTRVVEVAKAKPRKKVKPRGR